MSIVTPDSDLTTLGYALCALAAVLLFLAASFITRNSSGRKMSTKQLVYCGVAMALAFITSYLKPPGLPFGGSVTLFSMLFICLVGYWYGLKVGILAELVYGILQFLQEPFVLSFFQVYCDYILTLAALGLSGVFYKLKNDLLKGYILGIPVGGASHTLGGYLYWIDYMPDNSPQSPTAIYPFIYNYSYILAEGVLTVILIMPPSVLRALAQVKRAAME